MSTLFEVGKAYSFSVHPSNIIENVFDHVVCTATFDSKVASLFIDIDAMHAQVYSYIPSGIVDNASLYPYAQFRLQDGSSVVLGIPWINTDTIEVSEAQMFVVYVRGESLSRLDDLRASLTENGFTDIEIIPQPYKPKTETDNKTSNIFYP